MADSTCTDGRPVDEIYHPPVKRSIEIAGHKTSVSLEPLFWDLLRREADRADLPLNALVARIDAERIAVANPPGLATAIRLWLASRLTESEGRTLPEKDQ
ncbi:ribbon-helix-helix domain-containing protein [Aurantiacibacter spongiae]|uniref:Aryl-sulfate sulfotransferase n=1 Tax=Aurantiacibacter spongiae TaxID=2488860 RepID=A0A3N5CVF4_9SPHN|nr:ribbon-helix-helix domain-containing protein [Aurantiacibacter spongiae]RPF71450.1 aryl-sulfate sulfotransferase [Aurantiacibacter spongiae]